MIKTLSELNAAKERGLALLYPQKPKISIGMATCGLASGAEKVFAEINSQIKKEKLEAQVDAAGCLGYCQMEPLVDVFIPGRGRFTYKQVTPQKVSAIISLLKNQEFSAEDLSCILSQDAHLGDVPFFSKQQKIVLRNSGLINPESIEEYIARGGYFSLHKALKELTPEKIIDEVKKSGLRGRGGAGFPTGTKWEITRRACGNTKYIICNADEGDPGAYMDRAVLEGDPHSVLEGMIIAGYAIGANNGFIYVRTEYPLAIEKLKKALAAAKDYGFFGENIFTSGFNFDIEIRQGSGAFVCGEETALIHSIEGVPPEPEQRPPYPAQSGLWGAPTAINNVETFANIAVIIERGADWFSQIGTEKSKGTKVFSVVGKVNNTGLVEVPMGISLREIIYDIAGGIPEGKKFKAVQTGGPSGGCIPEELLDLAVDYESLKEAGSIMGSGGMVVMDEDTCMVDVAKFFLNFTSDESCGKCTSCREGSLALLEVLTRISQGQAKHEDLDFLGELSQAVKDGSLCGLGQTLPNPVLSTLKYFPDEYQAHIKDKRCPAGVCMALVNFYINPDKCQACAICAKHCPKAAISGEKSMVYVIDQEKCIKCGVCFDVCPKNFQAVEKISGKPVPQIKNKIKSGAPSDLKSQGSLPEGD